MVASLRKNEVEYGSHNLFEVPYALVEVEYQKLRLLSVMPIKNLLLQVLIYSCNVINNHSPSASRITYNNGSLEATEWLCV